MKLRTFSRKSTKNLNYQQMRHQKTIVHPFEIKKCFFLQPNKYFRRGRWSIKQKIKFCLFLDSHKILLARNFNRRHSKVFKFMSCFMRTRNPNQCRSHHQKVSEQYESFDIYINKIVRIFGKNQYQKLCSLYREQLTQLGNTMGMQQKEEESILDKEEAQIQKSLNLQGVGAKQGVQIVFYIPQEQINKAGNQKQKQQEKTRQPNLIQSTIYEKTKANTHSFLNYMDFQKQKLLKYHLGHSLTAKQLQLKRQFYTNQCNYYFAQWVKSVLMLEEIQLQNNSKQSI